MPMSKKHYVAFAAIFHEMNAEAPLYEGDQQANRVRDAALRRTAAMLAAECRRDNPMFDHGRFMSTCGFPDLPMAAQSDFPLNAFTEEVIGARLLDLSKP